ncbi:MAG: PQQ-like beta-propeller repeat protein, partial [bacterium]
MFKIRTLFLVLLGITILLETGVIISFSEDVGSERINQISNPYLEQAIKYSSPLILSHQQNSNTPEILLNISFETDCTSSSGLVIGDLNNDGEVEVIVGTRHNEPSLVLGYSKVHALNGRNGNKIWDYLPGVHYVDNAPALGDIDNDSKLEMIFNCGEGYLIAIEDDGKSTKWDSLVGEESGMPTLGDIDNDSNLEIIIGCRDGSVKALEAEDGALKWEFSSTNQVTTSAALGDINNDQMVEVVIGNRDGYLYALNGTDGSQLWKYPASDIINVNPLLADLDGDQQLEVV